MGTGLLISGLVQGGQVVALGVGSLVLVFYLGFVWLLRRGHLKSVKYFSPEGLVRHDGKSLRWSDLSRVVHKVRLRSMARNAKTLWRIEIHFKNGESAWVLPMKVRNFGEVRDFVLSLQCEHVEARA